MIDRETTLQNKVFDLQDLNIDLSAKLHGSMEREAEMLDTLREIRKLTKDADKMNSDMRLTCLNLIWWMTERY